MPLSQVEVAAALAAGWLATIAQTLHDYNALTNRLLAQVQDLTVAKDALGELNQRLESRGQSRTADLALANANLSATLDELRGTQKELVRWAQLAGLRSIVAGIAHELNTPIGTALTGATALSESEHSITFSDDGNGVPADRIAHLFEPFFTSRLGQGSSGLGLYIAYTQVRDVLGGKIEVSSVVGQGTCFSVKVPLVAPSLGS